MRQRRDTLQAYSERAKTARAIFSKISVQEPELDAAPVARHGALYPHKLAPYDLWAVRYEEPGQKPVLAGIYATEGAAKYAATIIPDNYMWQEGIPVTTAEHYMDYISGLRPRLNSPSAKVFQRGGATYVGVGSRSVKIDDEKIKALHSLPATMLTEVLLCAGNFEPYVAKKNA